jgi:hypothetical protein
VCGNHEVATLRAWGANAVGARPDHGYEWTEELSSTDWEFIRRMPFTISIPQHKAIVVHAGLVPDLNIEEQNPLDMVSMRNLAVSVDPSGRRSYIASERDLPGSVAWASVWQGPLHVFFGHDAKRRLQRHAFATGLDTGCLYGGQLTAVILDPRDPPRLVHVAARAQYVAPRTHPAHAGAVAPGWRGLVGSWALGPRTTAWKAATAVAAVVAAAAGFMAVRRWRAGLGGH